MADHPAAPPPANDRAARGDAPLFREPAVAARRQRWFGPARLAMPPTAAFAIGAASLVIVLLGAAVVSIEIPDRVRTYGVLLPPEGLLKVKAPRAGRVEYLPVANGDGVTPGQVLLRLSGALRAPGREPEPAARIASLHRELQSLEDAALRQAELAAETLGDNTHDTVHLVADVSRPGADRSEVGAGTKLGVCCGVRVPVG